MFDLDFLHKLREYEILQAIKYMAPGAYVLEIGGGTGAQARILSDLGVRVTSIDLESSNYKNNLVFPVIEYDGDTIPFLDGTFDIVFSSNTLEHVTDPVKLHHECRRVLKPQGMFIHIVPTASWRFWTSLAYYPARVMGLISRTRKTSESEVPYDHHAKESQLPLGMFARFGWLLPPRHGEKGNVFSEGFLFRRSEWTKYMVKHGYHIIKQESIGLFYTGELLLGKRLGIPARRILAHFLGSSCFLFRMK